MADEELSLVQRLRVVADAIELAEQYGFLDNDTRTRLGLILGEIARDIQQPVIDQAIDQAIAEAPTTRRERKALHRLRAKLALVKKSQDSTTD